ncbi:MAG: nucleotidyltransferase substrate binding protein [Alphaproteobacteria bacterium]|nr:nucleotidyltransferase substrate binding protein [Alphaproteobacteria bacterium]
MSELPLPTIQKLIDSLKEILIEKPSRVHIDAAIQRFEYLYQITTKVMQTYLKHTEVKEAYAYMCFKGILRLVAEKGLIDDPIEWNRFREIRSMTLQAYDLGKAEAIYKVLPIFIQKCEFLLAQLKERPNVFAHEKE